jgi:TRAP-type C4-dicarboxylate transport system permease small subunit
MTDHADTRSSPDAPQAAESHPPSLGFHRLLDRLERISGVVFILVVLLNFASAAGRYVAGTPILGADEVQVFTMIWLIFVGAAIAAMRRAHLRMDVLTAYLSPQLAWWRHVGEVLLMLAACALMVGVSADFTLQIYTMEQKSDAAEIPMWLPHLSVVVGFVGMLLCSLLELKTLITQRLGSSTHA